MMETAQFVLMAIGGLATVVGLVFGLGRVFGRQRERESVEASEILKLGLELAHTQEKVNSLVEDIHELDKTGLLTTQKLETLQGQVKVLFDKMDKQGEKLEKFFNNMYELKALKK